MERRIRVTGKGKLSVKPDTICLLMDLEGVCPDYEETIRKSTEETKILREALKKSGLAGEDLKTKNFSIQSEYESYRDENDDYQRKFVGYKFSHRASIQFSKDNKQLGRTLYALSYSKLEIEFSIRYTVGDPDAVKKELLEKAVRDSKAKAEVLTRAAGVKLGDIEHIDYAWGELEIYSQPVERMLARKAYTASPVGEAGYDIDLEADDIDVEDTVTIEWGMQ